MIWPASFVWFFGNTRFNNPSWIAEGACTKLSIYTPFKSCDSSLVCVSALSANAHIITDAVAKEVSSCFLHAFKRSKNVLPSQHCWVSLFNQTRTQVRKNHVWSRLSHLLLSPILDADSASLPEQHKKTLKKGRIGAEFSHSKRNIMMILDLRVSESHWERHLFFRTLIACSHWVREGCGTTHKAVSFLSSSPRNSKDISTLFLSNAIFKGYEFCMFRFAHTHAHQEKKKAWERLSPSGKSSFSEYLGDSRAPEQWTGNFKVSNEWTNLYGRIFRGFLFYYYGQPFCRPVHGGCCWLYFAKYRKGCVSRLLRSKHTFVMRIGMSLLWGVNLKSESLIVPNKSFSSGEFR